MQIFQIFQGTKFKSLSDVWAGQIGHICANFPLAEQEAETFIVAQKCCLWSKYQLDSALPDHLKHILGSSPIMASWRGSYKISPDEYHYVFILVSDVYYQDENRSSQEMVRSVPLSKREAIQIFMALLPKIERDSQLSGYEATFMGKIKSVFPDLGDSLNIKLKYWWDRLSFPE